MKLPVMMSRSIIRNSSLAVLWSVRHLYYSRTAYWPKVERCFSASSMLRGLLDARDKDHAEKEKQLIVHQGEYFDQVDQQERNKRTFHQALGMYLKQNAIYRRGHVEFLYAALDRMKEFQVHRDLDTYKQLLTLFPEGKMIARGPWEVEWMFYPKQQQCCIDVMEVMEMNGQSCLLFIIDFLNTKLLVVVICCCQVLRAQPFGTFPPGVIDEAIRQWHTRLRACIQAHGGHFEHRL